MHEKSHPAALLVTGPAASGEVSTLVTVTVVSADGTTVTPPTAIGAAAAAGATGADANRASPDSAPAGTVVATAHVTMSPAGAKFGGALVSSNPLFAARGTDIVLTRALSSTDDAAAAHATITAVQ
jgi:hypothetical protein